MRVVSGRFVLRFSRGKVFVDVCRHRADDNSIAFLFMGIKAGRKNTPSWSCSGSCGPTSFRALVILISGFFNYCVRGVGGAREIIGCGPSRNI